MPRKVVTRAVVILLTFSLAAVASSKLAGHWAEQEIKLKFMELYFPSLVQDNYQAFAPNGFIETVDFKYALSGLMDVYGYDSGFSLRDATLLNRKEAALIVARSLADNGLIQLQKNLKNPFGDLNRLKSQEKDYILNLNVLGVLKGASQTQFMPGAFLTQSQAIVLLQRVEKILAADQIPFQVTSTATSFSSREEGMFVEEGKSKVQVTITRAFPTPGFSMEVKRIMKTDLGKYKLFITIKKPAPEAILPQVITYQTIIVEIDKKDLAAPPYSFEIAD